MPKIFVQGEVGADRKLRRDAAHALEIHDAHGDEVACALVSEGIGRPEFASWISCETMHELVEWAEESLPCLIKDMDFKIDPKRMLAELSARLVYLQLDYGSDNGELPLHLAFVLAYQDEFFVLQLGDAKVCHIDGMGANEIDDEPNTRRLIVHQRGLDDNGELDSCMRLKYNCHVGHYEEGDLFLLMTPELWNRVGEKGFAKAYADHRALSEDNLAKVTGKLIVSAGMDGGAHGLTVAGLGMTKFTAYEKLGVKVF